MQIQLPNQIELLLSKSALILACVSISLVYYQIEPSPADYVMAAAAIVAGVSFIFRRKYDPFSWIDLPLLLYLVYVGVQAFVQYEYIDVRFALITLYLGGTYFVLKYIIAVFDEMSLRWIWRAYIFGAIFTALLMAYQMVDVYSFGGDWDGLYWGRPNGWFKDANVAGPFLLPAALYSLYRFISNLKWSWLGLFLIATSGIYLSFSRGAYLGYICGVALLMGLKLYLDWRSQKVNVRQYLILVAITIISSFSVYVVWSTYSPFYNLANERFGTLVKEYDTQGRAVAWESGIKQSNNSLFGKGSGSFEKEALEYQRSLQSSASSQLQATSSGEIEGHGSGAGIIDGAEADNDNHVIITPSAHNSYIRVLLENGVVGLALLMVGWAGLVIVGVRILWDWSRLPGWLQPYLIVSFVSFLAFLPMGTFIDTLHWRFLWIMAGILGGVIYIARQYLNEEQGGGQ